MHNPFGQLSIEQFLQEYWQKKPLFVKNAFPNFTSFISAAELAGLACEENIESRIIKHDSRQGDWQLLNGPFNDDAFAKLPESHWTLLVQAVDHWLPKANDFLQFFNFIPNWRRDDLMISYATQQGGTGPHYDNYDVFLIQANGKREWQVGGEYHDDSAKYSDAPVKILSDFEPEETCILETGDMLYLPPQIGHNGIALDNECITYSVGFRAPSHEEIMNGLTDFICDNVNNQQRYSDPDLPLQDNPGEITTTAINKIKAIIENYHNDDKDLTEWFGSYMTTPKYFDDTLEQRQKVDCSVNDIIKHIDAGGHIKINEGTRIAYFKNKNEFMLFVDGKCFNCDLTLQDIIYCLGNYNDINKDNVNLNELSLNLLQKLLEQESIYLFDLT